MNRAEIIIEDSAEGEGAEVRYYFRGGFNPTSPAHQLAQVIDSQLQKLRGDSYLTGGELTADANRGELPLVG
jgi:hypothetical protein